jgi:hypothetical protein
VRVRMRIAAALVVGLAMLSACDRPLPANLDSGEVFGPATVDGALTVAGPLVVAGPANIRGVVTADKVIVSGPLTEIFPRGERPGRHDRVVPRWLTIVRPRKVRGARTG